MYQGLRMPTSSSTFISYKFYGIEYLGYTCIKTTLSIDGGNLDNSSWYIKLHFYLQS